MTAICRRVPFKPLLLSLILGLFAACSPALPTTGSSGSLASSGSPGGTPPVSTKVPVGIVDTPEAQELRKSLDDLIDQSKLAGARWGVYVTTADGQVLYSRNANGTFTPASNMKVYTTAIALDLLGADYRWRTSVFAQADPDANGIIQGNLTLYGRGAPDLTSADISGKQSSFSQLADQLYRRGVRRIKGDVIGDESHFRGQRFGDGWLWNDLQWYYGAEPSALTINGNEVNLSVAPASRPGDAAVAKLNYGSDYFTIRNETKTVSASGPMTVGVERGLSNNELHVWGDYPVGGRSTNARISVHDPALLAARLFRDALRGRGIIVEGEAKDRDFRSGSSRNDDQPGTELAAIESRPLLEIIRDTNKESINLNAELIFRTIGKERGSTAPDPSTRKMATRGDDEAAQAVERKWLEDHGVNTASISLHDGSGLSRLDIITPESTVQLLSAMARTSGAELFKESLPEAGSDGTLRNRMSQIGEHRVYAKTGTLISINSLSGYVRTRKEQQLIFSIFCNEETAPISAIPVIDAMVKSLVEFPAPGTAQAAHSK
jgi:D-alanyl-D-alanine carboxypeptidase/D-alanyl-D-alanine-endopeptidase (penicillin-binding protein 4)